MDVFLPLKKLLSVNNPIDRLDALEANQSNTDSAIVDQVDEISARTGDLVVDNLYAPADGVEVTDPTSAYYSGAYVSGAGYTFDDVVYQIGAVYLGKMGVGFNNRGQLLAACGNLTVDFRGIFLNNSYVLSQIESVNGEEVYYGGFYVFGMVSGASPQMHFGQVNIIQTGSTLLSNGSFTDGLFTSWTQTGTPITVFDSPDGSLYCAKLNSANYITQSFATTAGQDYLVTFYIKRADSTGASILPSLILDGSTAILKIGTSATEDTNWMRAVAIVRATGASVSLVVKTSNTEYIRVTGFDCRAIDSWSFLGDADSDHFGNMNILSQRNITIGCTPATNYAQTNLIVLNPIKLPEVTTPSSDGSATGNLNTKYPNSGYNNLYFKSDHRLYIQDYLGVEQSLATGSGSATGANTGDETTATIAAKSIEDAINNGTVDKAPSENAVFDALSLKAPLASPSFTGAASFAGDMALGDAAADTLTFNGTPAGLIVAGTYTPTLSNTTNVSASTSYLCQYMRVGNTVTVSGRADVDPTAAGAVLLGVSLPIASNFGNVANCAGVAAAVAIAGQSAGIDADVTNDRARVRWIAVDVTNQAMMFTFTYQVI